MKGLSPKQKLVLGILENAVRQGEHLTVREIGDRIGVSSTCTVHQHLKALERKGYLKPANHKHRSIQLTSPPRPVVPVPFSGKAIAGGSTEALPAVCESLLLPEELIDIDNGLLFQVLGNSLTDVAIRDGDLVVVRPGEEGQDGDAVVAKIRGEVVVRQICRENGGCTLRANDPGVSPITVEDGTAIVGRVSLVIRRL